MEALVDHLGTTPAHAVGTVISTTAIYACFVLILNLYGQRMYAQPTNVELAVVALLGGIVARTALGPLPTLTVGIIALLNLLALETLLGAVRNNPLVKSLRGAPRRGVAIMVKGKVQRDALAEYHLSETSLWSQLRQKGVSHPDQVALVILEANGQFTVIKTDQIVHPAALTGVRGSNELLEEISGIVETKKSRSEVSPPPTR